MFPNDPLRTMNDLLGAIVPRLHIARSSVSRQVLPHLRDHTMTGFSFHRHHHVFMKMLLAVDLALALDPALDPLIFVRSTIDLSAGPSNVFMTFLMNVPVIVPTINPTIALLIDRMTALVNVLPTAIPEVLTAARVVLMAREGITEFLRWPKLVPHQVLHFLTLSHSA